MCSLLSQVYLCRSLFISGMPNNICISCCRGDWQLVPSQHMQEHSRQGTPWDRGGVFRRMTLIWDLLWAVTCISSCVSGARGKLGAVLARIPVNSNRSKDLC
jgi:hypothetical protein